MRVLIRCYSGVRDLVGEKSVELDLDGGATVEDALDALTARAGAGLPADLVVMRDRRHLDRGTELDDGDVVSITDTTMPEG